MTTKIASAIALTALFLAASAQAQTAQSGAAAVAIPAATAEAADSGAPASGSAAAVAAPAEAAAPAAKPAKDGFVGADLPTPPEGKGVVVFYRARAIKGAAVWFKVREDGKELGKLTNGVYFVQIVDPGLHTYTAATENKDTLKLEVDPGETYFVEGSITLGMFIGEANLSPSDQAAFDKEAHKLKLASPPASEKAATVAAK
jgi:hypothetical protein